MGNVFSLAELKSKATGGIKYEEIPAYGGTLRIGSLSSKDLGDWVDANQADRKDSGLRLIVRSVVDADGNRVPEEQLAEFVEAFRAKDAKENERVIKRILDFNDLSVKKQEALGNASGEASTDASPTA